MRTLITYEWSREIEDENGEIIDSTFEDNLFDLPTDGNLVLIRNEGNENEGVTARYWAYINNNILPEYFTNSYGNNTGYKVPNKFINELQKYYTQ